MKYRGKDIELLIPQRRPFVMVDEFECQEAPASESSLTGASGATALAVRQDNYFMLANGELAETGLIEHIAQSVSALAGYSAVLKGATQVPVGIIAEVKRFVCHRRPKAGERLTTNVTMGLSFGTMTLAHGVSCVGDETVGETDLKIFIQ